MLLYWEKRDVNCMSRVNKLSFYCRIMNVRMMKKRYFWNIIIPDFVIYREQTCLICRIPGWYVCVSCRIVPSSSTAEFRIQTSEPFAAPEWELEKFECLNTCCEAVTSSQTPHFSRLPPPQPPGFHSSKGKGSSLDLKVSYVS